MTHEANPNVFVEREQKIAAASLPLPKIVFLCEYRIMLFSTRARKLPHSEAADRGERRVFPYTVKKYSAHAYISHIFLFLHAYLFF